MKLFLITFILLCPAIVFGESCFTTLFQTDPFFTGISFSSGTGAVSLKGITPQDQNGELYYGILNPDQLTITPFISGFSATSRQSAFVDLGTESELIATYNITGLLFPTMSTIYSSISTDSNGNFIIGQNIQGGTVQQMFNSSNIFSTLIANLNMTTTLNHIYLIRTLAANNANDQRIVKLKIVDLSTNGISIRWDVLSDGLSKGACFIDPNQSAQQYDVIQNPQTVISQILDAPLWIPICVAILFIIVVLLAIMTIVLFTKVSKKSDYTAV